MIFYYTIENFKRVLSKPRFSNWANSLLNKSSPIVLKIGLYIQNYISQWKENPHFSLM